MINKISATNDFQENNFFLLIKKIVILFFTLFLSTLIIISLYFFSEKYFFDKLFYKKSRFHGYYPIWPYQLADWREVAKKFNPDQRNTDLLNLVFAEQGDPQAIASLTKERESSNFKIALIGDSMFFGSGVRKKQTIAYYLEEILKKDREVKVYNYSFFGDDFLDNYAKYQLVKKYLKPDLIIFSLVDNDLLFNSFQRYPAKQLFYEELVANCENKKLIEGQDGIADGDMTTLKYHPSFGEETQNFCLLKNSLVNFSEEDTLLFSFDCMNYLCKREASYEDCLISDIYYKFLSAFDQKIPAADLCGLEIIPVSEKEHHYSSFTNLLIAQKFAKFVFEKYPIFQ